MYRPVVSCPSEIVSVDIAGRGVAVGVTGISDAVFVVEVLEPELQPEMIPTANPSARTRMNHFIDFSPFSTDNG